MLDPSLQHLNTIEPKLHDWNIIPKNERGHCDDIIPRKINRKDSKPTIQPITWTINDLAKAGCLLQTPPIGTVFEDEQEMRRVYTLIYDVFRYKSVLMQALNDINFFQTYDKLRECIPIVWMLFYDLYHRSFKKRETSVREIVNKLFQHAKLITAENALWNQRVKLAAAVSRLRIKYNALTLLELLPMHLRNNKTNTESQNIPLTVWVNNKKFKNAHDMKKQIEQFLKVKQIEDSKDLGPENFKWDGHCPLAVSFHYSMRTQLAKNHLVRTHKLIIQDRSFCVGPATFWKVVEDLQLSGSVIQTHVNSPRSTAYLANLLARSEKIKKLMAFNAGKRKDEYETYLNDLGMTNVIIYSDRLVDFGFESPCMEEVVAVYATPPNSYSAVLDPIDLVCSRGGDLSMLEILTESDDTLEGRTRVNQILEEQKKTLKFAMSRPQIQVVLYETHSELDIENSDMVTNTLKEINKIAKIHHATLQGILAPENVPDMKMTFECQTEINNNEEMLKESPIKASCNIEMRDRRLSLDLTVPGGCPDLLKNVVVPDTDLFDTPELPCLCPDETRCKMENGCYLALIQRKQVLKLDNKYMIQMAEQRGLFGNNSNTSPKQKGSKNSRKKQQTSNKDLNQKKTRRKLSEKEHTVHIESMAKKTKLMSTQIMEYLGCEKIEETVNSIDLLIEENPIACQHTEIKSGGMLGNLTDTQINILISPTFKVSCNPCFSTEMSDLPSERSHKQKKFGEKDKKVKRKLKQVPGNASMKHYSNKKKSPPSKIKSDPPNKTTLANNMSILKTDKNDEEVVLRSFEYGSSLLSCSSLTESNKPDSKHENSNNA